MVRTRALHGFGVDPACQLEDGYLAGSLQVELWMIADQIKMVLSEEFRCKNLANTNWQRISLYATRSFEVPVRADLRVIS